MTTLSDSDLQKGLRVAYCLHPDRAVALCVLIDGCEQALLLQNNQRRRHGYRLHTPDEGCVQFGIYLESEEWEKDQESESPKKEPKYKPTRNDKRVRYVKTLVKESMDRHPVYGGTGVGTLLFQYTPNQISQLSEDVFKSDNIRRTKGRMSDLLKLRFTEFSNCNGQLPFEKPNDRQRFVIEASLSLFAPSITCPTTAPLLETYFDASSTRSDWERLHVLFGRFPELVNEYNSTFSKGNKMRLEDPENMLGCPKFDGDFDGPSDNGGEPPDPSDRFNPAPLTHEEISTIRHSLEKNKRRRKNYHQQTLRVVVDGQEVATITPYLSSKMLSIPATASCVKVFGKDEEGELLLAVFALRNFADDDNDDGFEHQLSVDESYRIELSTLLAREASKRCVWLKYSEITERSEKQAEDDSPAWSPLNMWIIGGLSARYAIKQWLGWEDTGEAYLALDETRKERVVIKVFLSSVQEDSVELHKVLSELNHPNLACVFDTGRLTDGRSFAVMENISGVNLRTRIGPWGMDLDEVVKVTNQLAEALGELHAHSIVHCDVKPDNIILQNSDGELRVKLLDFGVAEGLASGYTFGYAAPEVLSGKHASAQSDIYSLGVTVYEMLTGRLPFTGYWVAKQFGNFADPIPDLCRLRPDLPWEITEVISCALRPNPKDRETSAKEFGKAIAIALTEPGLPTRKDSWLEKLNRKRRSLWDKLYRKLGWLKANQVSDQSVGSQPTVLTLLQNVVEEKSPFEDLIAHARVQSHLRSLCCATFLHYGVSSEELYQEVCLKLSKWAQGIEGAHWQEEKERWHNEEAFFSWLSLFTNRVISSVQRELEYRTKKSKPD